MRHHRVGKGEEERKSGKRWRHKKDGGAETSREDNRNSDTHLVNTESPRGPHLLFASDSPSVPLALQFHINLLIPH